MNFRERLLAVLNGQRPDVMPWFADLTYWYSARRLAGTLPAEYQPAQQCENGEIPDEKLYQGVDDNEAFIKLHADHNVGYYLGYVWAVTDTYENVVVTTKTEGPVRTTRWQTPIGAIWDQSKFSPRTASSAPVKWAVSTLQDLRVLRYIADATHSTPNYQRFLELKHLANGHGHPTVLMPRSPISQLFVQWTGVTNLTFLLTDAREEVEQTLETLNRAADAAYEAVLGWDTPFVELPDNLTGEVITPWFKQYQSDYYTQRAEQLHSVGKKMGAHLDGTMRGILPLLAPTGLDFVEGITPMPVGDVAVPDLRDIAGPDLIIFGGIPGVMFAPPFTADDMRWQVELVIEHHWDYGKFIMGVGDQVPPNGEISLVRLVGDLVEELCT